MNSEFVVVGNPSNRRVRLFQDCLSQLGLTPARVVSYAEVLAGNVDYQSVLANDPVFRIDSPGEDAEVERGLIALGAEISPPNERPALDLRQVKMERGRIFYPALWYRGFQKLLQDWQRLARSRPIAWMNDPAEIEVMFDKAVCQERLEQHGLPIPTRLGTVHGYDELRARMRESGQSRVFVKLRHGSSASGVVAVQVSRQRILATTSVEMAFNNGDLQLFNSLRLRRYDNERDLAQLINALAPSGLHVESWLPKAGWRGATFDLRVLVIAGQVRHIVMRTSRSPLTNLHLGNRRGNVAELLREIPFESQDLAWDSCRRAAAVFPRSLYLGLDLMFLPGFRRHAILEINAFGDLLPGVLHDGQDTYTAEVLSRKDEG